MIDVPSFIHKPIKVNTLSFRVDLRFHLFFNTVILLTNACHMIYSLGFALLSFQILKGIKSPFSIKRSEQKRRPLLNKPGLITLIVEIFIVSNTLFTQSFYLHRLHLSRL